MGVVRSFSLSNGHFWNGTSAIKHGRTDELYLIFLMIAVESVILAVATFRNCIDRLPITLCEAGIMTFCTQCGNQVRADQSFCSQCGTSRQNASVQSATSSRDTSQATGEPSTGFGNDFANVMDNLFGQRDTGQKTHDAAASNDAAASSEVSGASNLDLQGALQAERKRISSVPPWRQMLANPVLRRRIIAAVGKSLLINGLLSALVIVPGILLSHESPLLGVMWLFLGSFGMMARTYARPWKLSVISALMPLVAAVLCYAIQFALFRRLAPPIVWVGAAVVTGIAVGYARASSHSIFVEDGAVTAQRTLLYLLVWAAGYGATQLLVLLGSSTPLIYAGLLTGAFSTAMLSVVSLSLLMRYRSLKDQLSPAAASM